LVETNACLKRDDVAGRVEGDALVIAADTLVFFEEHVMPKPSDLEEARGMLRRLSGNTHEVITGVAITDTATGQSVQGSETTAVTFQALSDEEIARFVEVVQPTDRAGAYTVDGPGSLLVAGYAGCYQNVLGLPMVKLDTMLREFGVRLFDHLDAERATFL
jgi:septum formation protein